MGWADEILHQIKHAAEQQTGNYRPWFFGHISSYDPAKHRVRVVIPSFADEGGNYVLSGWMPLGMIAGIQFAPKGGATAQNPTAGEPCVIGIMNEQYGSLYCASMIYNDVSTPAFTNLQPGEIGIKADSGSLIHLAADNSITIDTTANNGVVNINSGSGQMNVTTTGKTVIAAEEIDLNGNTVITGNLQVSGSITAGHGGGDQVGLQTHVHAGVQGGPDSTESPTAGT
jgi:hypothetical protein